jgi:Fe-S oxidoreductase
MQGIYNAAAGSRLGRAIARGVFGLVDSPLLSGVDLSAEMRTRGVAWATPEALASVAAHERANAVVIAQDAFTSFFDTRVTLAAVDLLRRLGFVPFVAPFRANGKALHVHGFRGRFERVARANAAFLRELQSAGAAVVGIEPAVTLTYRSEYRETLGEADAPQVLLLQEWLAGRVEVLAPHAPKAADTWELLPHCTEKTQAGESLESWKKIFAALGQTLTVARVGCCGMAGTWGHERENESRSRQLYRMSWSDKVNDASREGRLVATGYSCRSQVKRVDAKGIPHPVEALLEVVGRTEESLGR